MPRIDLALWLITSVLSAGVWLKLKREGLIAAYKPFAAMLVISLMRDIVMSFVPYTPDLNDHRFSIAWALTLMPLLIDGYAPSAINCYRKIIGLYPKIGRFGLYLLYASLGLTVLICLSTIRAETSRIDNGEIIVRVTALALKWVTAICAGMLAFPVLFFRLFPAPLKKVPHNLKLHTALLAGFFMSYSLTSLGKNLTAWHPQWFERVNMSILALLYVCWIVGMNASGEESEPWPEIDPEVNEYLKEREERVRAFITGA